MLKLYNNKQILPTRHSCSPKILLLFLSLLLSTSEKTRHYKNKIWLLCIPSGFNCLVLRDTNLLQKMVSMAKEEDVVKLVHPGRHVEILKEPITASEVMNKNPRHCITRPDFFEFPWIVVKPESVLTPGRVYYIVPIHTIYDSMKKAGGQCNRPPSLPSRPSNLSRTRPTTSKHTSSPTTSCAGMTPKHRVINRGFMSCTGAHSPLEPVGCDPRRLKKRYSQDESCPEVVTTKYRDTYQEFESNESLVWTMMEKRAWQANYEQSSSFDKLSEEGPKLVLGVDGDSSAQSRALKSCLRKPDSVRKSLSLRVTFHLPNIAEKRKSIANKSRNIQFVC